MESEERFPFTSVQESIGSDGPSQMLICGQRTDLMDIRAKPKCKKWLAGYTPILDRVVINIGSCMFFEGVFIVIYVCI